MNTAELAASIAHEHDHEAPSTNDERSPLPTCTVMFGEALANYIDTVPMAAWSRIETRPLMFGIKW